MWRAIRTTHKDFSNQDVFRRKKNLCTCIEKKKKKLTFPKSSFSWVLTRSACPGVKYSTSKKSPYEEEAGEAGRGTKGEKKGDV